jgi:chemotaxis protein methyltransferase WspC
VEIHRELKNNIPSASVVAPDPLEQARTLADRGKLVEASAICRMDLQARGPSAPVFYLLGVIADASAQPQEALECYRKAIYLDPNHYEAILQLAVLMEKAGNNKQAASFRARACRLKEKT